MAGGFAIDQKLDAVGCAVGHQAALQFIPRVLGPRAAVKEVAGGDLEIVDAQIEPIVDQLWRHLAVAVGQGGPARLEGQDDVSGGAPLLDRGLGSSWKALAKGLDQVLRLDAARQSFAAADQHVFKPIVGFGAGQVGDDRSISARLAGARDQSRCGSARSRKAHSVRHPVDALYRLSPLSRGSSVSCLNVGS